MNFLMKKKIDMSVKNPKLIAEQIIKELNIRNPSELRVRNIAMTRGMFVKEQVIDGAEGRLLRKGNRGIITINKNITDFPKNKTCRPSFQYYFLLKLNRNIIKIYVII